MSGRAGRGVNMFSGPHAYGTAPHTHNVTCLSPAKALQGLCRKLPAAHATGTCVFEHNSPSKHQPASAPRPRHAPKSVLQPCSSSPTMMAAAGANPPPCCAQGGGAAAAASSNETLVVRSSPCHCSLIAYCVLCCRSNWSRSKPGQGRLMAGNLLGVPCAAAADGQRPTV